MKIWFKLWTDTRLTASETIEITDDDTRTHKVFRALEEAIWRCRFLKRTDAKVKNF